MFISGFMIYDDEHFKNGQSYRLTTQNIFFSLLKGLFVGGGGVWLEYEPSFLKLAALTLSVLLVNLRL